MKTIMLQLTPISLKNHFYSLNENLDWILWAHPQSPLARSILIHILLFQKFQEFAWSIPRKNSGCTFLMYDVLRSKCAVTILNAGMIIKMKWKNSGTTSRSSAFGISSWPLLLWENFLAQHWQVSYCRRINWCC